MLAKDGARLRVITTEYLSREIADEVWEIINRADLVDIKDEDSQPASWDVGEAPKMFNNPRPAGMPLESHAVDGTLPRGKYAGKTRDWVVDNDPSYVEWLHDNEKAAGLGFTAEHIEEAKILLSDLKKSKHRYTPTLRGPWKS